LDHPLRGSGPDATDQTTYTFAGMSIGPLANRSLVCALCGHKAGGARTLVSITIGGITATVIPARGTAIGGDMWLAYAVVPTGTTANVVMTLSSGSARAICQTFALYNLRSIIPVDTAADTDGSTTIDCPVDGMVIAGAGRWLLNSTTDLSWTGLTERDQQTVETSNIQSVAASLFTAAQTNLTIAAGDQEIVAASWR